jgi:hypothetical protein
MLNHTQKSLILPAANSINVQGVKNSSEVLEIKLLGFVVENTVIINVRNIY